MKAMRSIINNLRPVVLDLGLNAAIEWQVKEFQRRTGIACELMMPEAEIIVDDDRATALFRILQESLNNVLRHAKATRAQIELYADDGKLTMRVADNGVGIFPGCRRKANSFGLVGIKERVSTLGGQLVIENGTDKGTTITVSIPMETEDAEAESASPNASETIASLGKLTPGGDALNASVNLQAAPRRKKEARAVKLNGIA
jgi:signal transduction histidine kinase